MTPYRLGRTGDVDVLFEGDQLAHGTSKPNTRAKVRWSEVTIYRADSGRYVVEIVGASDFPGETDRRAATVCNDPEAVREALYRPYGGSQGDRRFLTNLARRVLTDAAAVDKALVPLLEERV